MGTFFLILFTAIILYIIYKVATTSRFKSSDNEFEQAGVRVVFDTGKITINGKTYDAEAVQSMEYIKVKYGTTVILKVDDFKQPIHKVTVMGFNDAGEKFMQRLSAALRKAGGNSFY